MVEGIFSHFANAEDADLSYSRLQVERFQEVLHFYEEHGLPPPRLRHIANSGAILQLPEAYLDMVRPGLLLYGVYPDPATYRSIRVHPALSWKSRVVYFKVIKPGHPVELEITGGLFQSHQTGSSCGIWVHLADRSSSQSRHCPCGIWGWLFPEYVG